MVTKTRERDTIVQIVIFIASCLADVFVFVLLDEQPDRTPTLCETKTSITLSNRIPCKSLILNMLHFYIFWEWSFTSTYPLISGTGHDLYKEKDLFSQSVFALTIYLNQSIFNLTSLIVSSITTGDVLSSDGVNIVMFFTNSTTKYIS